MFTGRSLKTRVIKKPENIIGAPSIPHEMATWFLFSINSIDIRR